MQKSTFSLAYVLAVLAALTFGFVCFLGLNYSTLGDKFDQNIIRAFVISSLLCAFAIGSAVMKEAYRNFRISKIFEIVFLISSAFTILLNYSDFSRYFAVDKKQEKIQMQLRGSISQAKYMFWEYEYYAENRKKIYERNLRSIADSKVINHQEYLANFDTNSISDEKQIENKMEKLHFDLFPSNYTDLKNTSSKWFGEAQGIIENWKPIGIVSVVKVLEEKANEWNDLLTEISKVREKNEQADNFTYRLQLNDVKGEFTLEDNDSLFSIGAAGLLYLLMLLPWLSAKQNKEKSGNGKIGKNEVEL